MGSSLIQFHIEEIDFKFTEKRKTSHWIKKVLQEEGFTLGHLNYIFCGDEYLLEINQTYLNHNTYTDIITFNNSEEEEIIEGDIFISIERIRENAEKYSHSFKDELDRVIVHGVLHLCGYKDKTKTEQTLMREKEDYYLAKRV
ncbi:MAG TPA: rRNA maturation RNase YbeY [Cytophagaceae bacterium]